MDMFINIQKADADGNWIPWYTINEPHPGAWGKCRISHREISEKESLIIDGTMVNPVMAISVKLKVEAGRDRSGRYRDRADRRIYHKGEKLRIQIAGRYIREGWFEPLAWDQDNKGNHVIYTGGKYESFIQCPVIPPKYRAGEYVYR